jgi:urease accessory protein
LDFLDHESVKVDMTSPFPKSSSAPGEGHLVVQLLPYGISGLETITFQYPLKLISPSPTAAQKSILVFLLTYGGGLVGGDQVQLRITIQPKARLSIVTQGHTKIFKSAARDIVTRQKLSVTIEAGAALCLLPDPVQPFEGSVYEQSQIFNLADSASICLLDWVSQGRSARGEDWDCHAWRGRNEFWSTEDSQKGRLVLRDNVFLEGDTPGQTNVSLKKKMQGLGLFGTLILKGALVEPLAVFFMAEFAALPRIGARDFRSEEAVAEDGKIELPPQAAWRARRLKQEKADGILWSAAKVRGCIVVKFGARTVEGGRTWIGSMLKEEGSIERVFGDDALMCVR